MRVMRYPQIVCFWIKEGVQDELRTCKQLGGTFFCVAYLQVPAQEIRRRCSFSLPLL